MNDDTYEHTREDQDRLEKRMAKLHAPRKRREPLTWAKIDRMIDLIYGRPCVSEKVDR